MEIITIVQWVSYVIAGILLLTLPLRMHLFTKKTGQCLLLLTRRDNPLYVLIMVLAVIMLFVLKYREFSMIVAIVLHLTALLGIEMSCREMLHRRMAGVYEESLIVDGRFVKRESIILFPTLEYEQGPARTLEILTQKNGTITVHFENETERSDAVAILREWVEC